MANSKIFRKAQERSPGLGNSKDGYFNFSGAISTIKKSQIKKCEPYHFLSSVSKKIGVTKNKLYFKILFTNVYGQVKLLVSAGTNKDHAVNNKSWMVVGNVLTNKVQTVVQINKSSSRKSIDEKNKKNKDNPKTRRTPSRAASRRSRRFRKRTRKITRRSTLKKAPTPPAKDQLTVSGFTEEGIPVPEQFNTSKASVPAKDFASIFEDSNNKLYDEEQQQDVQVENPPGVAKFVGMGVDIDRPSIIASTELSPIIFDDSLDVYDQIMLDRKFRLETVYKNLEKIDTEDIESLLETLQEFKLLTEDAINATTVISLLDDALVNEISTEMLDLANILGFNTSYKNSQLYSQVISDLSVACWLGTYKTETGPRNLAIKETEINYDSFYSYSIFGGTDIYSNALKSNGASTNSSDPKKYEVGYKGTFLGYTSVLDPPQNRGMVTDTSRTSTNLGRNSVKVTGDDERSAMIMQAIYFELMMSRLIDKSDTIALAVQQHGLKKIASAFLGDFKDPTTPLNDIDVPEALASIIKFKSGGENYFPLEQFISPGSGLNGRTFLDAVVQPAVGSIIEDTDPNFDLLNAWVENSRSALDQYFKYTDIASLDGGAAIVCNEIILTLIKCITDKDAKIGSSKHPFSSQMEIKNEDLDNDHVANILNICMGRFSGNNTTSLAHIYNTMGYCFFEGQNELVERVAPYWGFGLLQNDIQTETSAYRIAFGNWSPTQQRSISDGDPVSEILNNIYEEFSRFFNLLENNLMTSIDLLLADSGLLTMSQPSDYNSKVDGYFDLKQATVSRSDLLSSSEKPGNYEATKFSGIPRIYLRHLLAKCCHGIFWKQGNAGWAGDSQNLVKAAKVAVENLDPELGPVRWKITHGPWPLDSGDFEDLSTDDYNSLVPSEVRDALEGNVDVEVETDEDGNLESINVEDPTEGWEFVNSTEGFCPLTLMLEGEDNSDANLSMVRGNRALFDNFYDQLIEYRATVYKMKQFLEKPLSAYQNFPEVLEESVGNISLDSLKIVAQLPGIDGQELVKFTSENQIGNIQKSIKLEYPSEQLRYLPNIYAVGDNEFNVARRFIDDYLQKNFSEESKAIIQTVGIPTGLLSSLGLASEKFSLTREVEYMFYPNLIWSEKLNYFHPSVYLIPGSFTNCNTESSYTTIIENAKYFISNKDMSSFVTYSEARDYLNLSDGEAEEVFKNHCLDFALQLTIKLTTGMSLSEETFRINKYANNLLVTDDGQKNIEVLLTTIPDGFADIFKDNGIASPSSILSKLTESTASEINTYLGCLECRLITPEDIAKKVLSPRVFDRVFSLIAHPDEHYTDEISSGLQSLRKSIDGQEKLVYQISLEDGSTNSVKNDHFASYYYKAEQK